MTNLTTAEQQAAYNGSQYNSNRYDQTSNVYGYSGTGYLTNFPQSMNDAATMLNAMDRMLTQADTAATAAAAVVASRPKATSLTSNTIVSTGSLTFATVENLITAEPFFVDDFVNISADTANYVFGRVTAVSANSLTVSLLTSGGSGTYSSWTILGSGAQGAANGISSVSADTAPALGGNLTVGANTISFNIAGSTAVFNAASNGITMNRAPIKQARLADYWEYRTTFSSAMNNYTLNPATGTYAHLIMAGALNILPPTASITAGSVCAMLLEVTAPSSSAYALTFDSSFNTVGTPGGTVAAGTTSKFRIESDTKSTDGTTYWKLYQIETGRTLI